MTDKTFVLALWATAVSTFLALIKIWEVCRDRPRLTTSYSLSSLRDRGNKVMIENTSKVPALITYWELTWAYRVLGQTLFDHVEAYPDEGYCNIVVSSHSVHTLDFSGQEYFPTRTEIDGYPVALYLRVYLAGRKSAIWLLVWKSNKLSLIRMLRRKFRKQRDRTIDEL